MYPERSHLIGGGCYYWSDKGGWEFHGVDWNPSAEIRRKPARQWAAEAVGGEIVTAPNFSELQVALFGEHTSLAAWTPPCWSLSSHSCFFMRHLLNFVSLVLVIDEGLGFLHLRLVHVFCLSQWKVWYLSVCPIPLSFIFISDVTTGMDGLHYWLNTD